jgi:hypothetical protein
MTNLQISLSAWDAAIPPNYLQPLCALALKNTYTVKVNPFRVVLQKDSLA